ncbi:hypothetical protein OAT71_02520 [Flavobacteriales bacterium]|nr:hypothetical protein [Flavobacteriales bacterium]
MVRKLLYILTISISLISCDGENTGTKKEGSKDLNVITFDISYPNPPKDPFIKSTLPDSMMYFFKDDFVRTEVNLAKGNIQLNYIANSSVPSLKESMKVYFTKSKYSYTGQDINNYTSKYTPLNIKETGKTKVIVGHTCKEALVSDPNTNESYNIYYTEELESKDPNWFTPFPQIKGVIFEYQMVQYNFLMKVKARKIETIPSDSLSFKFSSDYQSIDKEELDRNHATFEQFGI